MPDCDDLTGLGTNPQLSELLGAKPVVVTCQGTTQATTAVVKSKNAELLTAGGATACIIPSTARVNNPHFFANPTATSGLIFVPSGHTLNGTLNGSVTIAQNKAVIMWQYKPKFWVSILTA